MFLKTLTLAEALEVALARTPPLAQSETLAVGDALGRVLAESLVAPQDLPGFDRSSMDGYAVRAEDTFGASEAQPVSLTLVGRVEMGQNAAGAPALQPQQAVEISTGGMLPAGADAVVILEETELDGQTLRVLKPCAPGSAVIRANEDFKQGQTVLNPGQRLRPQDLGALLALGITQVNVLLQPHVAMLSTGDELVPPECTPMPGQVRDINTYTTAAQVQELGLVPIPFGIVPDRPQQLAEATTQALAECDAVLISGGSSVGVRDATVEILGRLGEVLVHGIRIAPGKPTIFACCGDKPVFGLPGNPVSSIVVFEKFVAPVLRKRSGATCVHRPRPQVRATLTKNVPSARGRNDFVRVRLIQQGDQTLAEPIRARSNNISSLSSADAVLPIPANVEGYGRDERVTVELW